MAELRVVGGAAPGARTQREDAECASVDSLVRGIAQLLEMAGIPDARVEARDIVATVNHQPRHWPVLHRDVPVSPALRARAIQAAALRARGAPFAYAVGEAAFRHLTLEVNSAVLIPRQETEHLVELVLEKTRDTPGGVVVDAGTGSGAIALALANEGNFDRVIATDISEDALRVARRNVAALRDVLRCPVELRAGDLLAPVRESGLRAVVSNPPYIAHEEARSLPASVRDWEPAVALFSAGGGIGFVQRLVNGSARLLQPGGLLAIECDASRTQRAARLLSDSGFFDAVNVELDLSHRERFVFGYRGG